MQQLQISSASEIVLVADGAPWIWNNVPPLLAEFYAHQITQILDYYHATQYIYQAGAALLADNNQAKAWADKWKTAHSKALGEKIGSRPKTSLAKRDKP